MIEDFVSIITSFAARIYGKRSQRFRKIKKLVEEIIYGDKEDTEA